MAETWILLDSQTTVWLTKKVALKHKLRLELLVPERGSHALQHLSQVEDGGLVDTWFHKVMSKWNQNYFLLPEIPTGYSAPSPQLTRNYIISLCLAARRTRSEVFLIPSFIVSDRSIIKFFSSFVQKLDFVRSQNYCLFSQIRLFSQLVHSVKRSFRQKIYCFFF